MMSGVRKEKTANSCFGFLRAETSHCWKLLLTTTYVLALLFPWRFEYEWSFFSTLSILEVTTITLSMLMTADWIINGRAFLGDRFVSFLLVLPIFFALLSLPTSHNASATIKSIVVYGSSFANFFITLWLLQHFSFDFICKVVLAISATLILTAALSYIPGSPLHPESVMPANSILEEGFLLSYQARFSHPFLGLSNNFATILAMLLPTLLALYRVNSWSWFSGVLSGLVAASLIATGSRGVLLAVTLLYAIVFFWRLIVMGRLPKKGLLLALFSLLMALGFILINPVAQNHLMDRFSATSMWHRLDAFISVFYVLEEHPFGIGSGVSLSEVTDLSLRSVHNAYLQNMLWFGWLSGIIMSIAMWLLPLAVIRIPAHNYCSSRIRKSLCFSIILLLIISFSQASWEGSVLRIWIYFIVATGITLIKKSNRECT